jgi:hypothetical protein
MFKRITALILSLALAVFTSVSVAAGWIENADGTRTYYYEYKGEKYYEKDRFITDGDKMYYISVSGKTLKPGRYELKGYTYLIDKTGAVVMGWVKDSHGRYSHYHEAKDDGTNVYWFEAGYQDFGWTEVKGKTYYFDTATGFMATGKTVIDDTAYTFGADGVWDGKDGVWVHDFPYADFGDTPETVIKNGGGRLKMLKDNVTTAPYFLDPEGHYTHTYAINMYYSNEMFLGEPFETVYEYTFDSEKGFIQGNISYYRGQCVSGKRELEYSLNPDGGERNQEQYYGDFLEGQESMYIFITLAEKFKAKYGEPVYFEESFMGASYMGEYLWISGDTQIRMFVFDSVMDISYSSKKLSPIDYGKETA